MLIQVIIIIRNFQNDLKLVNKIKIFILISYIVILLPFISILHTFQI